MQRTREIGADEEMSVTRPTRRRRRGVLAGLALAATLAGSAVNSSTASAGFTVDFTYVTSEGHCQFPVVNTMVSKQSTYWRIPGDYPRVHISRALRPDVADLDQCHVPGDVDPARLSGSARRIHLPDLHPVPGVALLRPIPSWATGGEWVPKDDGYGRRVYTCRA